MADETLEWDLKLDADTSGGTKMEDALGRVDKSAHEAKRGMEDMERGTGEHMRRGGAHVEDFSHKVRYEFGTLGHSINYAKHELKDLAEAFGLYEAFEGVKKLTEKVFELGEEMFSTAAKSERFEASFKLALGAEPGGQLLEYIEKVGHHTEFTQEQLKEMNLELAKSGFKGAGIGRGMEAAIDLAALSGNAQEGGRSAIEALRRVMTTGKLQARTLMPFGITEKQFLTELASETGLGVETVKKKLEKGTIDVDTTLNSLYTVITQKTGKKLGGAGADMETLFSTRFKNLKEIPDLLYEKMSKSSGFKTISDWIGKVGDQFGVAGEQGTKILDALTDATNRFGNALGGVDVSGMGDTIADLIVVAGDFFAGAIYVADKMSGAVQVIEDAYLGLKSMIPGATGREAVEQIRSRLHTKQDREIHGAADKAQAADEDAIYQKFLKDNNMDAEGKALGQGLAKGGEAEGDKAGEKIGHAVHRGTKRALGIESPSKVFAEMGRMSGMGFSDGIEDSAADVDAAISKMVSQPASSRGGVGMGGDVQVSMPVTVNVSAGDRAGAEEIANAVAEKINEIVPGKVQSMFEQLAMQTGSAA